MDKLSLALKNKYENTSKPTTTPADSTVKLKDDEEYTNPDEYYDEEEELESEEPSSKRSSAKNTER